MEESEKRQIPRSAAGDSADGSQPPRYRSYMSSPFIVAALPLRDVKKNTFERKYNNLTLTLTGKGTIPFGRYGRLLLSIFTTHAVLSKKNDGVMTYKSIKDLLEEMQLPKQRGEQIKEQLEAFSHSTFFFEERRSKISQKVLFKNFLESEERLEGDVKVTAVSTGVVPFFDSMSYGELDGDGNKKKTIAIRIVLSEKFRQLSKEHAVPIDYSTYKKIPSSLGKDLYAWFVYKNNALNEPVFISRTSLVAQFFTDKNDVSSERHNWSDLKNAIKDIKLKYYQDLNVSIARDNSGITLSKSNSIILNNDCRYVLVTSSL